MVRPAPGFQGPFATPRSISAVQVNTGVGGSLIDIGNSFFTVARALKGRQDEAALIRAKREGVLAGSLQSVTGAGGELIPTVTTRKEETREAEAFNQAAFRSVATRLNLSTRVKLRQLETQYRGQPRALEQAVSSWAQGVSSALPLELQAGFQADALSLAQPVILAEYERKLKADAASKQADLVALGQMVMADAQTNGRLIASGGATAEAAFLSQSRTYVQALNGINSRIDGLTFTEGQAREAIVNLTSTFTARTVQGIFDGVQDKTGMFRKFLRGELSVPVPAIDDAGNVTFEQRNAAGFMSLKDQEDVRTYMSNRVTSLQQLRNQARADADRAASLQLLALQRQLAVTGDPDTFTAIQSNPQAGFEDIERARTFLTNGVTDPGYFRSAYKGVLAGHITDVRQLDPNSLDRGARQELDKLIQEQNDAGHWSNSIQYRGAEDDITKAITGTVTEMVAIGGTAKRDQTALAQRAAANMILALRQETDFFSKTGIVGRNRGDAVIESVQIADPETGAPRNVDRFDPRNWFRQKMADYRENSRDAIQRIEDLKTRRRELREKAASAQATGMTQAELDRINDQINAISTQIRDAKLNLTDAFNDSLLGDFN